MVFTFFLATNVLYTVRGPRKVLKSSYFFVGVKGISYGFIVSTINNKTFWMLLFAPFTIAFFASQSNQAEKL